MITQDLFLGEITLYAQNDLEVPKDLSPSDQRLIYHYIRNCGLSYDRISSNFHNGKPLNLAPDTIAEMIDYIDDKRQQNLGGAEGQHWNRVGLDVQKWGTGPKDGSHHQLFLVPHAQAGEDWTLQPNQDPAYATGDLGIYSYVIPPREQTDPGQGRA